MAQFAALALTLGWGIPTELKGLAKAADSMTGVMQQAYEELLAASGKPPSQRAVAKKSGYSRDAVTLRWSAISKNRPNQAKPGHSNRPK
jgi:hypothetical protein